MGKNYKKESWRLYGHQKPLLSEEDKEEFLIHLFRLHSIFEETFSRATLSHWEYEVETFHIALLACARLRDQGITPAGSSFRARLKREMRLISEEFEDHDPVTAKTARTLAKAGGLIERAFKRSPKTIDEGFGKDLLKRLFIEHSVVKPLKALMQTCSNEGTAPEDMSSVLEEALARLQSFDGIETKAVKTLGDDWSEHRLVRVTCGLSAAR
jgi:hypothetical protein